MVLSRKLHVRNKKYGKIKLLWQETLSDGTMGCAMSGDGERFYNSSYDRTQIFSKSGKELGSFETDGFMSISLTFDGRFAVVTTLSQVLLISTEGYKVITNKSGIHKAAISPKGDIIVVAMDNLVECFNLRGEPLWESDLKYRIWEIGISREARRIIIGTGKEVCCFDFYGKLEWRYRTGNLISEMAVSIDGGLVAACSGKQIFLFNKLGQVSWSKEVGTVKCLSASDDFSVIALGHEKDIIAFNHEGGALFNFTAEDFVNSISISAGGETVIAGTGSEIFNKNRLYCFERHDSEPLWSYDTRGNVACVSCSGSGEFVAAGDSKRVYFFDNVMIIAFTCAHLIKASETKIKALEKLKIKLKQEKQLLEQAKSKEKKKPVEALKLAAQVDRDITSMYTKFERARKNLPDWIRTLGLSVTISEEHIGEILPIFAEYNEIKDSGDVDLVSKILIEEMMLIQSVMDAVNKDKINKMRNSRAIQALKIRMIEALGAYNALAHEKDFLDRLQGQKVQFLMNLEDQIRTIFLDVLSKRSYKRKLSVLAGKSDEFSNQFREQVREVRNRVEYIAEWIKHDSDAPEDTELYIEHEIVNRNDYLDHTIAIENNYDFELRDIEVWAFANRGELQLLGNTNPRIFIPSILKNSKRELNFRYKFMDTSRSGIHGYIAFSPPREFLESVTLLDKANELQGLSQPGGEEELDDETTRAELKELLKLESAVKQCFRPFAPKTILGKLGIKTSRGLGPETLSISEKDIGLSMDDEGEEGQDLSCSTTKYLKFSINEVPSPQFFIAPNPLTHLQYSQVMDSELTRPWQRAIDIKNVKKIGEVKRAVLGHTGQLHLVKESKVKTKKGEAQVYWFSGIAKENVKVLLTIIIRKGRKTAEVGFSSYSDDAQYMKILPQTIIADLKERFQT